MEMKAELSIAALTALALIYGMFRNFKSDIREQFSEAKDDINKQFSEIKTDLKSIKEDVTEIKERLSFLEAANIYTMPSEPSPPNNRSLAAIKMHQRRRERALANKE